MIISRVLYVGIIFGVSLNILPVASQEDKNIRVSLELANPGCEDVHSKVAKAIFEEVKNYNNATRDRRWNAEKEVFKNEVFERKEILKYSGTPNSSREIELLLKRGKSILNESQQSELLDLEKSLAFLKYKLLIVEEADEDEPDDHIHNITSAEDFLRSGQNTEQMKNYWQERFELFYKEAGQKVSDYMFGLIRLLKEEAQLHEHESLPTYWEEICEVQGQGYNEMNEIWNKIKPTYEKLSNFVMSQYKLDTNSSLIPPYLLGSFKGDDWSLITPVLLESDSLDKLNEFEEVLKKEEANDKLWAIKRANVLIEELGLQIVPVNKTEVNSTSRCPDKIVTLCLGNESECNMRLGVALCPSSSYTPRWYKLIEMIEQLAKDAYTRTSKNTCIINFATRYSALETAVPGAVVLRALERSDLPEDVIQLIIALRTLPALGQALIADHSRFSASLDTAFGSKHINTTFDLYWTRAQRDIFGVEGNESWQTYLVDDNIITNKPSLSKFLGLILQFRLIKSDNLTGTLNNLARIGFAKPWPDAVKDLVISQDEKPWEPLLHYLQPLNNIIEKDGNENSDTGGNTVAYACVGVVLLVLALGVAWWYWKKHRTDSDRGTINSKRGRYSTPKSPEEEGRELQNL